MQYTGVSFEKYAVVVTKANESSPFGEVLWAWPTQNGLYLFLVYLDSFLVDHMDKIEEFGHAKLTFLQLSKESQIYKYFEYQIQVEQVLLPCPSINKNIIKEYKDIIMKLLNEHLFMHDWKLARALFKPNGMTRNS